MGLATLILGLIVFLTPHVFVTRWQARERLIGRIGLRSYKIGFSIIAALGLVLIVYGFARYRAHEWVNVWFPPVWTRHLALVLMWPAIIMIVAAYIPGHIKRILKHPMLAGVKLWALAHLMANGDLGSIILFGAILAWAVYDRIALKRRPTAVARPVAPGGWPGDLAAIVVGTLLYAALVFLFHPLVIGVPVI